MTSVAEVAAFMVAELERTRYLYQQTVVYDIEARFGAEFIRMNTDGNTVISKEVLAVFNKLTPDVVWDRGARMWRAREPYDKPGRQQ